MKLVIKSLLATSLTLTAFAGYNDQQPANAAATQMNNMDPNPKARYGTKNRSNVWLTGEFLYVKVLEAESSQNNNFGTESQDHEYTTFKGSFKPGVRATLGYNTTYDGWDTQLVFTGFTSKRSNAEQYTAAAPVSYGTLTYKYNFYQGDLDLGRMFKVSRKLKLRPHVGVRGVWLKENATQSFGLTPGSVAANQVAQNLNNTAFGLEAGLDTVWMLSKEFSLYSNLGFTSLVNKQDQNISNQTIGTGVVNERIQANNFVKIVNGLDFALGFRWDRMVSDDAYHIGINLGYEQHTLNNLNPVGSRNATAYSTGGTPVATFQDPDFTFQAITLGLRFDF